MADPNWQAVHDLLINIAEESYRVDPTVGTYLRMLVRLHNLYPDVSSGISDDPVRAQVMKDIHQVIAQTLVTLLPDVDGGQS